MNKSELQLLSDSSKWLYNHRNDAQWFRYFVLTQRNKASDSLKIEERLASNYFTILEQRNLLIPVILKDGNDKEYTAYKLNLNNMKEWGKVMRPPTFFNVHIMPKYDYVVERLWLILITSAITVLVTKLIEKIFK